MVNIDISKSLLQSDIFAANPLQNPCSSNIVIPLFLSLFEEVLEELFPVFVRCDQNYSEHCCQVPSYRKTGS